MFYQVGSKLVTFRPGDQWFAYARTEYTALGAPGYGQSLSSSLTRSNHRHDTRHDTDAGVRRG